MQFKWPGNFFCCFFDEIRLNSGECVGLLYGDSTVGRKDNEKSKTVFGGFRRIKGIGFYLMILYCDTVFDGFKSVKILFGFSVSRTEIQLGFFASSFGFLFKIFFDPVCICPGILQFPVYMNGSTVLFAVA